MSKQDAQYILYVGQDVNDKKRFCVGSREALRLIDSHNLNDIVTIQSVHVLREKLGTLPPWLTGTPTLVSRSTRSACKGSKVIEQLRQITEVATQQNATTPTATDEVFGMTVTNEKYHLDQESNLELSGDRDDPSKYDDSKKITDADVQRFVDSRKAMIPPT